MPESNIKLFKIASEINIGRDAIVEFLISKGFKIENKSTAILTEEMVEAVYEKFKREKKAFEKQREKLEKHKIIKKPEIPKKEEEHIEIQQEKPKTPVVPKVEVVKKKIEIPVVNVKTHTIRKETIPIKPGPQIPIAPQIQQEESITPSEEKKEKIEIAVEPKVESKVEPKIEFKKDKPAKHQKQVEFKKTEEKEKIPLELKKKTELKQEAIDTKPEIESRQKEKVSNILVGEEKVVDKKEKQAKKKKKHKKILEVELDEKDRTKLKGLTIVGKIDLDKKSKEIKLVLKPGLEEEVEEGDHYDLKSKKKIKPKGKQLPILKEKLDKKKKRKRSIRELINEEDITKALRETLAGMEISTTHSQKTKVKQKKKAEKEEKESRRLQELEQEAKILRLSEFVTTSDLANLMNVSTTEIIRKCLELGLMVTINQRLDKDTIMLIASDYGYDIQFLDDKAIQNLDIEEDAEDAELFPRSPIVTIMGHVDHGKTSLLDFIRNSNIVAGEAGGITQHIGAYKVELDNDRSITFLDTPGHEAFTAMRARGAQVTDIVVLVVAADDSVLPQTIEAISHALAANVPIVVAINKIDKPDAKPDRIKQQLSEHGILVEDWGGKYQSVEISAKYGTNVDLLLDKILLEAELLDLKANPNRKAKGTVIEANMTKGFGPVATIIVQNGTLHIGDSFVAGTVAGKVRAMLDERSNKVLIAEPSTPVRVIGFDGLPEAGDILNVVGSETEARIIANQRQQIRREQNFKKVQLVSLDDLSKKIHMGDVKELKLIIKTDVGGSAEALSDSLQKLSTDEVRVQILHKGVGSITENDVMLAAASGGIIIGFQVTPTNKARKLAESEAVEIRNYNIIYDCINDITKALEGLLTPDIKEDILATIEVRKVFKIGKHGNIAGCYVQSGKVTRNDKVRLLRDGLPLYNGRISSLKRLKDDVREVEAGYECGIALDNFNDFEEGDIIECYKTIELKRTLN